MSGNAYKSPSGFYGSWELHKTFYSESYRETRKGGGWTQAWERVGSFIGILGDANARAIEIASARQQEVSHQIVAMGSPAAFSGDRLVVDINGTTRYFYVQNVEDPGGIGRWSIYDVMEGDQHGS